MSVNVNGHTSGTFGYHVREVKKGILSKHPLGIRHMLLQKYKQKQMAKATLFMKAKNEHQP